MSDAAQAFGLKLKAERERRGVSAQKMADDMHLDSWVIDALETGDYQRIGPSVYANGHLKKYASILGVSASDAAPRSETKPAPAGPAAPIPIIRMDVRPVRGKLFWPKLGGFAAMVLIAGAIVWWRPWHRSEAAAPIATVASRTGASHASDAPDAAASPGTDSLPDTASSATAASSVNAASSSVVTSAPGVASSRVSAPAPASAPAAADSATVSAALTPGVGRARLRLSFSADSRVDVYDYSGRAIFTGSGRANSVKTISGIAPFRVYLGFASGVQLQVNDRAVAIGPQFVAGDVARFEAGADGVLRRDTRAIPTNGTPTVAASPRG